MRDKIQPKPYQAKALHDAEITNNEKLRKLLKASDERLSKLRAKL